MEPFQRPLFVKLKQRPKGDADPAAAAKDTANNSNREQQPQKSPEPSPLNDLHAYNTIKARIFGDLHSDTDNTDHNNDGGVDGDANNNTQTKPPQKQQNIQ